MTFEAVRQGYFLWPLMLARSLNGTEEKPFDATQSRRNHLGIKIGKKANFINKDA